MRWSVAWRSIRRSGWAALLVAVMVCATLPLIDPAFAIKGHRRSVVNNEGVMEQFQWPWYVLGAAVLIAASRRAKPQTRGFYYCLIFVNVLLGWREADLDKNLIGERWYNTLSDFRFHSVSWIGGTVLWMMFLAVLVWAAWLAARHWKTPQRWLATHDGRRGIGLAVAAAGLLLTGMMVDKGRTIERWTGFTWPVTNTVFAEEVAELLGAIVFFLAMVEFSIPDELARVPSLAGADPVPVELSPARPRRSRHSPPGTPTMD